MKDLHNRRFGQTKYDKYTTLTKQDILYPMLNTSGYAIFFTTIDELHAAIHNAKSDKPEHKTYCLCLSDLIAVKKHPDILKRQMTILSKRGKGFINVDHIDHNILNNNPDNLTFRISDNKFGQKNFSLDQWNSCMLKSIDPLSLDYINWQLDNVTAQWDYKRAKWYYIFPSFCYSRQALDDEPILDTYVDAQAKLALKQFQEVYNI